MSATIENGVNGGLEGVVAFATEIAEPDRAGGARGLRGVDVEELVGRVPFEQAWGLLVDGTSLPGLELDAGEAGDVAAGGVDARRELQAAIARIPARPLIDLDADQARDELAKASAATLALAADIARAVAPTGAEGARAGRGGAPFGAAARFLARWRGDAPSGRVPQASDRTNHRPVPGAIRQAAS